MEGFESLLEFFDLTFVDFWMILVCSGLFTIYWKLSSKYLFEPLLHLAVEREKLTTGAQTMAQDLFKEAESLELAAEQKVSQARTDAIAERLKKVSLATAEAQSLVISSETAAKESIQSARVELSNVEGRMRADLMSQVDPLASELSGKILSSGGIASGAINFLVLGLFFSLFYVDNVFAAGSEKDLTFAYTYKYWPPFLVFVLALYFILKKPFLTFFEKRSLAIEEALDAGVRIRSAAEKRIAEARQRVADVDIEINSLLERMANEADAECKRLISEANDKAAKIANRATKTIEAEKSQLEQRLREELADAVLAKSRNILSEKIDLGIDKTLRGKVVENANVILN